MGMSEALNPGDGTFNVPLTDINTEYSQILPVGTKQFAIQCRTAFDVRFAYVTGKVAASTAPFLTCKAGQSYSPPEKVSWSTTLESQIDLVTMGGTWLTGDTLTVTIGGKSFTVTVGASSSTTNVATLLSEAWQNTSPLTDTSASFTPERGGQQSVQTSNITAKSAAAVTTLTSDSAGEAFTLTASTTSAAGTATILSDGTGASVVASSQQAILYLASSQAAVVVEIDSWQDIR